MIGEVLNLYVTDNYLEDLEHISDHLKLGRTSGEVMGFLKLIHSIIKAQIKRHFDSMEKNSK